MRIRRPWNHVAGVKVRSSEYEISPVVPSSNSARTANCGPASSAWPLGFCRRNDRSEGVSRILATLRCTWIRTTADAILIHGMPLPLSEMNASRMKL